MIAQLRALDTERAAIAEQPDRVPCGQKIAMLRRLRCVGEGGATTLVAEVFCRASRTEGISPATWASQALVLVNSIHPWPGSTNRPSNRNIHSVTVPCASHGAGVSVSESGRSISAKSSLARSRNCGNSMTRFGSSHSSIMIWGTSTQRKTASNRKTSHSHRRKCKRSLRYQM